MQIIINIIKMDAILLQFPRPQTNFIFFEKKKKEKLFELMFFKNRIQFVAHAAIITKCKVKKRHKVPRVRLIN